MRKVPRVLSIAGSDCSGGAGIQADIKTIIALGGYAMTAITAVTVQNTQQVSEIYPLPAKIIAGQIEQSVADIGVDTIKVGMIGNEEALQAVTACLSRLRKESPDLPIVIDPVMASTSGSSLLNLEHREAYMDKFLPLASIITPNIPEAEKLTGDVIKDQEAMRQAASSLQKQLGAAILVKGGHLPSGELEDCLQAREKLYIYCHQKIDTRHTHGTGCTLSSAIATFLGKKESLPNAVGKAADYVHGAIEHAPRLGHGSGPLGHTWSIYPRH